MKVMWGRGYGGRVGMGGGGRGDKGKEGEKEGDEREVER